MFRIDIPYYDAVSIICWAPERELQIKPAKKHEMHSETALLSAWLSFESFLSATSKYRQKTVCSAGILIWSGILFTVYKEIWSKYHDLRMPESG